MRTTISETIGRTLDHRAAARQGRRAGTAGLSVDEAADTAYLVGLRGRLAEERADIARSLAELLAEQEAMARDADATARTLRAARTALVARARELAQARRARYEELCAVYGEHWQRRHRDRSFAHIGWRCPPVPDFGEVGDDAGL